MSHRLCLFATTAVLTMSVALTAQAASAPLPEVTPAAKAPAAAMPSAGTAPAQLAPAVAVDPALGDNAARDTAPLAPVAPTTVEPATPAAAPVAIMPPPALEPAPVPQAPAAPAASTAAIDGENRDFIDYASRHCMAMLKGGQGDLTFMLGRGASKFFSQDTEAFNRTMAARIIRDYGMDVNQNCSFDMVSVGQHQLIHTPNKPVRYTGRLQKSEPRPQDMVVVGGEIPSVTGAPVSIVYRFERMNPQAWAITNISINGQPMTDRFRDPLEEAVAFGGVDEALGRIATMY